MSDPRNPFRLRASEHIESDAAFLRLFEPAALAVLPSEDLWDRVLIVRSAPGGGKTSILRLFEPGVLLTLLELKRTQECSELFDKLHDMGAVDEDQPRVLGIKLSFARNYDVFANLPLEEHQRQRLFLGLLNAQMILSALRAISLLRRLRFPDGLHSIQCSYDQFVDFPPDVRSLRTGGELFRWATDIERDIYRALDSFRPATVAGMTGHSAFLAPRMLRASALRLDGRPLADHTLLMMDDAHILASSQRQHLLELLAEDRSGTAVWMAERNQALSADEMLGAQPGRDYGPVSLESHWRARHTKFATVLQRVADRRTSSAADFEVSSFVSLIESSRHAFQADVPPDLVSASRRRAIDSAGASPQRYADWLSATESKSGDEWERAMAWEALTILIHRDLRKAQTTFDFALDDQELEARDDSGVHAAAELFLSIRHRLPYYFGFDRLSRLASSNIEQFLAIAGDEFEEISAGALLRGTWRLTPRRQDALIRKASAGRWSDIRTAVRYGGDVVTLLARLASFGRDITFAPNAPYAPGVTGIGISTAETLLLRDPEYLRSNPSYLHVANVLASAIAHNLLEPLPDQEQGKKGATWYVLYLNRLLCVRYDLPLQYGGWRHKTVRELSRWLQDAPTQSTIDLA